MFNKFCQVIDNDMKILNQSWNKTLILKSICCFWNWKKKILLCCVMTKMRFGQNICHRFRYGYRIWFKPITFSLYAHDSTRLTNFDSNSFYDSWNTNWDFRYPNMYLSLWLTELPLFFLNWFLYLCVSFHCNSQTQIIVKKNNVSRKIKVFFFFVQNIYWIKSFWIWIPQN